MTAEQKPRRQATTRIGAILNWTCTPDECQAFRRIAQRAFELNPGRTIQDYMMDLEACHCNGCELDIEKLESAPPFDLAHDVFGIVNHLDRTTGKLMNCFLPRCAKTAQSMLSAYMSQTGQELGPAEAHVDNLPREVVAHYLKKERDCWITAADPIGLEEELRKDLIVAVMYGRIELEVPHV